MSNHTINARVLLPLGITLVFLLGWVLPVLAMFIVPEPQGYVTDLANVLSPDVEQHISNIIYEVETKTNTQMAVLTIPSLDGAPLEEASLDTAREWGVGNKSDRGLLLFVAVNDRKMRTEIGYGLEGTIPDGLSGEVRDQAILPYFKQGNYEQGILNGMAAYAQIIAKETNVRLTGDVPAPKIQYAQPSPWADILFIALFLFIILYATGQQMGLLPAVLIASSSHSRSGYYGGGGFGGGGFSSGGFSGFGGGGFGGGGSSGGW